MWHVVWFKRDLRAEDHEPLVLAAASGAVLAIYIVEPELWTQADASGRQWAFVRESLVALREALARVGLPLVVRSGDVVAVFARLHRQHRIAAIHAHQETGNDWTFQRDRRVLGWAREQGIAVTEHPAFGVVRRLRSRDRWTAQWERVMRTPVSSLQVATQPTLPFDPGVIPEWPTPALVADSCPHRQRGGCHRTSLGARSACGNWCSACAASGRASSIHGSDRWHRSSRGCTGIVISSRSWSPSLISNSTMCIAASMACAKTHSTARASTPGVAAKPAGRLSTPACACSRPAAGSTSACARCWSRSPVIINIPRIYNPIRQSQDQDPRGIFIRRGLPHRHALSDADRRPRNCRTRGAKSLFRVASTARHA